MKATLKHKGLRGTAILAIVFGVILFWVLRPVRETSFDLKGFTPQHDDSLAAKFTPHILAHSLYGAPTHMFYRMAKDTQGNTYIAYHPYFHDEENPHEGFGAKASRLLYSGGLHLKDIIFGKADLELIEVVLDAKGNVSRVAYEDAEKYNPKAFGVKHVEKTLMHPKLPLCFEIVSWNHMVRPRESDACSKMAALKVEYFTDALWDEFRMVKKTEAILRRNRAHRVYERSAAK